MSGFSSGFSSGFGGQPRPAGTLLVRSIGAGRGLRFDFVANPDGVVERTLGVMVAGRFSRYEANVSGGSTWSFQMLAEGEHDILEGKLAALAQGVAISGDLTAPVSSGTLGHVPLLLLTKECTLVVFSGGANAEGYVELWQ